jgi:pimeloyl-ACP methyl ester carboxylesterase
VSPVRVLAGTGARPYAIKARLCDGRSLFVVEQSHLDLTFAWAGITLAGTLHLPAAPPPHPAVLMLQGSGPADRDGGDYFPPIRDAFLARGIAAFSFDKPGIGGSTGDWRHYALMDRTDQALAALAFLRDHAAIDRERIGVWGQSQGGWLVQMIAARLPDLAFAIANSGPGIAPGAQDHYGVEHTMRAEGKSEEAITRAIALVSALRAAAARGDDYATVERDLLGPVRGQPWADYFTIEDAEDWGLMCRFVAERYEPAEALAQVRCPLLAVFGERDPLLPAWESAQIYGKALREAGNTDATVVVFPQGNHSIRVDGGNAFAVGYLDLLADWAAHRVSR